MFRDNSSRTYVLKFIPECDDSRVFNANPGTRPYFGAISLTDRCFLWSR